ncbi:hypothetical protein BGZ76_010035, partial [Entomortierella beljakovae]
SIHRNCGHANVLPEFAEQELLIDNIYAFNKNEIKSTTCQIADFTENQPAERFYNGATVSTLISNLTFDILLLVELARLCPSGATQIFKELLKTINFVPQSRLAITIYALKDISACCEYFLPQWLKIGSSEIVDAKALNSTTLGVLLTSIQSLLSCWKLHPSSVKMCLIAWFSDVLMTMEPHRKQSSSTQAWNVLKRTMSSFLHQLTTIAGADEDEIVRGSVAVAFESFIKIFGSFCLGPEFLAIMTDRSLDISPMVGAAWKRVIFQTNPFAFAFGCYWRQETEVSRALKILVLKSPNSGIFRYPHFSSVLSSLETPSDDSKNPKGSAGKHGEGSIQRGDMLQRLFHSCQGKDIITKVNSDSGTDMIVSERVDTFHHSLDLLTYWSLWETARYCVLSRLRTPFGGPQQTLDTLEKQLNSLLVCEKNNDIETSRMARLRDFLLFLDRLELQVYNAHHGTALGIIPLTPKPSIAFVRSNKKMWDDWFARIRSRVIGGAKSTGEHAIIIRNGFILLADHFGSLSRGSVNDILPWLDEFERVLVSLVEALVATGSSDVISGVYTWCRRAIKDMTKHSSSNKSKSSRSERSAQYIRFKNSHLNEGQALALSQTSLDWINTAVSHAQNRYEQSVKAATSLLDTSSNIEAGDDAGAPAGFLCQEITNSLSDLNSYHQLHSFLASPSAKAYSQQTMLWNNNYIAQSLDEFCANETGQAWKSLEDFYETCTKDYSVPDSLSFDRVGVIGRNYLYASKVHDLAGLQQPELDQLRQRALSIVLPTAEFLLSKGLDRSSGILVDAMMLNTPISLTPQALSEFMDQLSLIPDELRMAMLHRDLRYWGRLDTLVNLARSHAQDGNTTIVKQSNDFKYLLSKVARRSDCHEYACNIPRTWIGILSPEIQFEEAKTAMIKHDYSKALLTSGRILENTKKIDTPETANPILVLRSKIYLKMAKWSRTTKPPLSEENLGTFENMLDIENQCQQQTTQARIESITAMCLEKAIDIGPRYRKAWFSFGTHHYKQGWGILDELGSFRLHHPVATVAYSELKSILEHAGIEKAEEQVKANNGELAETEIFQSAVSDEITATLRLLRLLAKHGGQLSETFQEKLVDINVGPWINIIPQLFARLDHPEKTVQSLISDLLCKIGEQYPQLIVFHCVVGANSSHNTPCQRRLLGLIGDSLNKYHSSLTSQVQSLIRELEKITVLWEEVWYKKIMTSLPELKNTLQELMEQYQGLGGIDGLDSEEKNTMMADNYRRSVLPLLAVLESLLASNANPESNHERWFVSTFKDRILAALDSLRSPKAWDNLFGGLTMLKEIYMDLGKELSGTRILKLSDLSPGLSSIQSSLIDIPDPSHGTETTIQSFEQQVVVIPTKTKPKKLTLLGSNGKRYTYLFKGLEDLHLDERVMQLLRISNGMLQRDKESHSRQLSARHYAVVPLSDNSGMIQWVENTVSIFTIIAKWQHRELMCNRWMSDDNSSGPQAPQRATEVYHEKAVAALKKAGLPSNHPRRQWPKSMLLDLYHEMANETPADLLEREIWASSPTPAEWWRKSVRFARSTAVMSMIGYVIGLGDRHLDNILIDFTTGDLVHIDYNVCFEKGKKLRIPEIVPFRLTRNMLTSLGVTGVEGNFRISCELTMKVMRKNKEILVTLLEAFIYDPLVDWQIETVSAQGSVGIGGGGGGGGIDMGQGIGRDSHQGLVEENDTDTSNTSTFSHKEARSSTDLNNSVQPSSELRRRSNESMNSVSSTSTKSTTTTEPLSKKWSGLAGEPLDSGVMSGTTNPTHLQPQESSAQQDQQQPNLPSSHQRNAYAVHILRRVRHKLEGRDFEAAKKCKVTEQVERVIQEATNTESLANISPYMSHLIDPCLRATKIAHGIRRGIDGISPLSGLVPELRILIQEQKNVLTSLKRTTFEKDEAAKHLGIYAKTEGPDIADTLTKLSILIQRSSDLERDYSNSLAQSRELFKEIRVAEDDNYSVRKRRLDLEQKLALEKTSHHQSTTSLTSTSSNKTMSIHGPELHPEIQLLRRETITVENELEDLKRKKIKTATKQQLDALEKLGKELIVIAHYGHQVMSQLDDSPTPAGVYADDRFAGYEGEAKTTYSVKACMDTFKEWPKYEPQVRLVDMDLGDFPKDNKQAMDAMLQDVAAKSGSDWFAMQTSPKKSPSLHGRTNSVSSTSSASPRHSMSSSIYTTTTYVDGIAAVQAINEIPPTPDLEDKPLVESDTKSGTSDSTVLAQEPIPIFVTDNANLNSEGAELTPSTEDSAGPKQVSVNNVPVSSPSPFVPQSTYRPTTKYQSNQSSDGYERTSPQTKSRPQSAEIHTTPGHAPPHPLMMPHLPQSQPQRQMYPPGPPGGPYSTPISMPIPTHMPMHALFPGHMPMPVPHIPGSPDNDNYSNKRHSQPITVSFPMAPLGTSSSPGALDHGIVSSTTSSRSSSPQSQPRAQRRNPHAVLAPTEPGFRIPPESEANNGYDGPPPDYAEASMQLPAEVKEEKSRQ